jgi:hypothetical protein
MLVSQVFIIDIVTSSCDNLMRRLERLEECGVQRQKEVDAIKDMSKTVLQETKRKLELMESRIDCKVYEKCGSTFDAIETRLMNILREDLLFLGTSSLFGRPEGIDKTDTGVKALIKVLHQTAKKPTSPSPIKAKVTTPLNIQYLEEASRLNLLTMEEKDSEDEPVGRIPFLNAQSQILANSQSQASIATKPFIYTNAEETFSPLKESVTEQDIVPQKTASLLSNPTPIEIKELSLSIPEANELPPLPE